MKIVDAKIYKFKMPFKAVFSHNLKTRLYSDSLVIKVTTDNGCYGYGEGIVREYLTNETVEIAAEILKNSYIPSIIGKKLPVFSGSTDEIDWNVLNEINKLLPEINITGIIAPNAANCAIELAILDCILKNQNLPLSSLLPPIKKHVDYSGVISHGNYDSVVKLCNKAKSIGFKYYKLKVSKSEDVELVKTVRKILGDEVSLRLDANGAFTLEKAISFIEAVQEYNMSAIEQPIARGSVKDLAFLKSNSPVPIIADESLITIEDAYELAEANACDYFNIRLSKCGGFYNTLKIAKFAEQAGIKIQLGCLVGETAILSSAGRGLAGHLADVDFVEGSYGSLLLESDISDEPIEFGPLGRANLLTCAGLGITINGDILELYSKN